MSFGLLISPAGSAGVCRGSCSPERSRRHADLTTGRGLDCSRWPSPSSVLAHGQEQDLPGSLAVHPVTLRRSTTPDGPLRLANSGASGAAPTFREAVERGIRLAPHSHVADRERVRFYRLRARFQSRRRGRSQTSFLGLS